MKLQIKLYFLVVKLFTICAPTFANTKIYIYKPSTSVDVSMPPGIPKTLASPITPSIRS